MEVTQSTELGEQLDALPNQAVEALVKVWESQAAISPELRSRVLANDMVALTAHQQSEDWVPVDEVLASFGRRFLLIMGENDEAYPTVKEYSEQLPEGSLASLPGLNHLEAFQRSDLVIPLITGFLENS